MKIVRAKLFVAKGGVYRRLEDCSVGSGGGYLKLMRGGYGIGKGGVLYVGGLGVKRRKVVGVRRFSLVFDKTFK